MQLNHLWDPPTQSRKLAFLSDLVSPGKTEVVDKIMGKILDWETKLVDAGSRFGFIAKMVREGVAKSLGKGNSSIKSSTKEEGGGKEDYDWTDIEAWNDIIAEDSSILRQIACRPKEKEG